MTKHTTLGRKILLICLSILILTTTFWTFAQDVANKPTPLRVGYVYESHYFYKNSAGEYQGYVSELVYNIAMRANFDVQFVDFANYAQEDQALAEGKIDVEMTVPLSERLRKKFAFSDTLTTTASYAVLIRKNDDRYNYGDMSALNTMSIAVIKNDAIFEVFAEWCKKNDLHPSFKSYDDANLALQALNNKEADGLITSCESYEDSRLLLTFGQLNCYAMFNVKDRDLLHRFDAALKQILTENPLFEQELYTQYVAPKAGNMGTFTQDEKAYIASHPTVKIAVPSFAPPHIFKGKDGKFDGIIPSYYAAIGKRLGLNFTFVTYPAGSPGLTQSVLKGDADVVGYYVGSFADALKKGFRLIEITDDVRMVQIARMGVNHVKKVATLGGNIALLQNVINDQHFEVKKFNDINECYKALSSGTVDAIICTSTTATWVANNHRMEGFVTKPLNVHGKLYMAVATNNSVLYGILSKSALVEKRNFSSVVANQVLPQSDIRSLLERLPVWGLGVFASVMATLVLLLIALVIVLHKHYREKTQLANREMSNEREKVRLEALEKSAEEKNQFFANISHDLRTPLNAIIGFSDLALKKPNSADTQEYMQKINSSGKLMLDLVNDTLTLSKINSGKLELQLEPMATTSQGLFFTVWEDIKTMAAAKNITFTVSTEQAMNRVVLLDKLKMQKIMLNLLGNAVKYTPAGGHITVRLWNETGAAGRIDSLFSVQDDGIGIKPEFQAKIFEPFTQEQRRGYETTGTGLGLTIVKQLVELMGGTISLVSEVNKGSTFTIRLHFQEASGAAVHATEAAKVYEKQIEAVDFTGKKILVCEDNKLNREIACILLKAKGITVVTAENGRLGVATYLASHEGEYDAILMDLRMPEMDGFTATAQIRRTERFDAKTIPIIAMTADVFAEDIQKCLAAGMNDHIAKPIKPQVMFQTLAKHLF